MRPLPRYSCDCLPAGPDGQPSDDPDAIYTMREVVLLADAEADRAELVEALRAGQAALDFYWPHDEHGEVTLTPEREEPYWGARADKFRAALSAIRALLPPLSGDTTKGDNHK